jgi:DNA-binding NtrC family response regulator
VSAAPFRAIDPASPIRVLIAEDEPNLGMVLEQFMAARGFAVTIVRDGRAALDTLRAESFDVALLDVVMPEVDGLEVLRQIREEPMPPEVIVITGNGTIETAIAALKLGAYDFLSKPYRMAEIEVLVKRAWEKRMLAHDNLHLRSRLRRTTPDPHVLTHYAPLRAVLSLIDRVAPSASTVLITGESGTGKDLVARLLHARSAHPDGPFVDLNCAALTEALLESELFGMERGAWPGADQRKVGLVELAAGGTLYLDNVGALDLKLQAKLVRALESGSFCRVGGTQKVLVNVRVVASSTRDLSRMVQAGTFREDFLHRINTIRIALPALRERVVDIPLLATHFLEQFGEQFGQGALQLGADAIAVLERYRWPGNVRELRNVMERATLLGADGVVSARDLPLGVEVGGAARPAPHVAMEPAREPLPPFVASGVSTGMTLEELERRHVASVLDQTNWHQGRAADILGISPKTLYRKIREYGFKRPAGGARV